MSATAKRRIVLPAEQAEYVDALVATGAYASASDVVKAGLEALQDRDTALDRWLREDVLPVYDAMQADPDRALSVDQVRREIGARSAAGPKVG